MAFEPIRVHLGIQTLISFIRFTADASITKRSRIIIMQMINVSVIEFDPQVPIDAANKQNECSIDTQKRIERNAIERNGGRLRLECRREERSIDTERSTHRIQQLITRKCVECN